jgi:hypothetical protein
LITYFFIFVYSLDKKAKSTMTTSVNSTDHVSFSVARQHMQEFFEKFVPTKREYCINPECVKETEAAVLYIWEANSLAYEHTERQPALNITTMWVTGKKQWIRSHYCCECFKKHVLVGENKNASHRYWTSYDRRQQNVHVIFNSAPYPSSTSYYGSGTVQPLTEFQIKMLGK